MELCPQCQTRMDRDPPHPAEPDCNIGVYHGGWVCPGCEYHIEDADPRPVGDEYEMDSDHKH